MQAECITEAMIGEDFMGTDEEWEKFLESLSFPLKYHELVPLAVKMFEKYQNLCRDNLELLICQGWNVSEWSFDDF